MTSKKPIEGKAPPTSKTPLPPLDTTGFDIASPDVLWGGAFWYWARYGGDFEGIVDLLRKGIPLSPERAGFLADVLEGLVHPSRAKGGPSVHAQEATAIRNVRLRMAFQIAVEKLKATEKYPKGGGAQLRQDAMAQVGQWANLSVDAVRKIVDSCPSVRPWKSVNEMTTRVRKKPP